MDIRYILASPVISIYSLSLLLVLCDAIWRNKSLNFILTITGLVITAIFAGLTIEGNAVPAGNSMPADMITGTQLIYGSFSAFFDILFCIAGLLALFAAKPYMKREYRELNEFYSMLVFAVCGMITIAHSSNLLVLFIGIELMSVSFYVLAGFFRTNTQSVEASLKYFLLGAFATGFLLYGIALIYGASSSLDLAFIKERILAGNIGYPYFSLGLGLLIIGLSFKIAAFPFHQWAPDVYHGSPTIAGGFLSSAGKAAAITAFIITAIYLIPAGSSSARTFGNIAAWMSAITMLIGNFSALVQKNVKRMLSYSSVAHAGYLLMGVAANNREGMNGMLFYSAAYIFMQMGAFIVISTLERASEKNLNIDDYSGLSGRHPYLAASMAVFMLSLAGIPPFAGFFGKYYLFIAAINGGYTWLTIVAVISTIISIYYYIGLILTMYFKESSGVLPECECGTAKFSLIFSTLAIIIIGLFPSLITNLSETFFK